ncbi:MAG: DUF4435 domain-containing protein [Ignavibacteriaceae bacterium]
MKRLIHKPLSLLRGFQLSSANLIALVEGKEIDPYFYGKISEKFCKELGLTYSVRTAKDLDSHTGGKEALIKYYKCLRRNHKLVTDFKGKKTIIIFFLDKDLDDLLKIMCRSKHVIYTNMYDIQNHLFKASSLIDSICASAHVDPQIVNKIELFKKDWLKIAAERWKEWIAICVIAKKYKLNLKNYRATSQINEPINGPVNKNKLIIYYNSIKRETGWSDAKFKLILNKTLLYVDRAIALDAHDKIFKGKWYSQILEKDLRDQPEMADANLNGFCKRMISSLMVCIDYDSKSIQHFFNSLNALFKNINKS